jgi:hypothetical protein
VDETGLYWKKMPSRTSISHGEEHSAGYKPAKDYLTLLLGGNASGTVKLNLLLVCHSGTPRMMKSLIKAYLPVIWTSNRKAWVTQDVFMDWYTDYFCPTVHHYCGENNYPRRMWLLLSNAPGHLPNIGKIRMTVDLKVEYLPPNTSSLLQPMDQGIIANLKAY